MEAVELAKTWTEALRMFTDDWDKLSADERFETRLDVGRPRKIEWASAEAEADYKERVQLFRDA